MSVVVLMVSGFAFAGLAGVSVPHAQTSAPTAPATTTAVTSPGGHSANRAFQTATTPTVSTNNVAAQMASNALAATKAAGLKPNVVFVPRPSATPAEVAAAKETGVVTPLYTGTPAPIGLAYYGLSAGPGDAVQGTVLNTTGLVASVDTNATGVQAANLVDSSPDSFGIQLNAVMTNVTLFGTPGYSFWTQNVVEYYPATHFLILITNIWNFSGGPLSSNVFYQHGPYGTQVGTEYYYAEYIVPMPIYYPFDLNLYENSTLTSGRNTVVFTVQLSSSAYPSEDFTTNPTPGSQSPGTALAPNYDWAIFNSTALGGQPLTTPSNYTANGLQYNPIGLTDDFELIFGGPGGGSQATLFEADATLGLAYWTGTGYQSVPAAYGYGGETGETVTGANVAWSNVSAYSPYAGERTYGIMSTGPSVMTGLWNASTPEGYKAVNILVNPVNAFDIVAPIVGGTGNFSGNFTVNESSIAPQTLNGSYQTLYLIPGNYSFLWELSGYEPYTTLVDVTTNTNLVYTLTPDAALGVYTPLWAFSNAEVAALAASGSGTTASPYVILNSQAAPFSPIFGLYNDYTFPAYPGVFFYGTNVTTEFVSPPSLSTFTNDFQFPGIYLPSLNDLQYWFWNVSNVAVLQAANISGWFGSFVFYPAVFDTFNMIFYEGGHNLIASDTFQSLAQGLLIFAGGNLFAPPFNIGGGNNTVWGNVFEENFLLPTCSLATCEGLMSPDYGIGLQLGASGNLVYNNEFLTPTTAWLLPLNLYSGYAFFYSDQWNITPVAGTVVNHAAGFPSVALTGNILGPNAYVNGNPAMKGWQGGNYWWDYGVLLNPYNGADNPFGVLPYDENAPTLLVYIYGPAYYYATYIYPGGDYAPLTGIVPFQVTFTETGLSGKELAKGWTVSLDGTTKTVTTTAVTLTGANGWNEYMISGPSGYRVTGNGQSGSLYFGEIQDFSLAPGFAKGSTYTLSFKEKGLPVTETWCVDFSGANVCTMKSSAKLANLTPGDYPYAVAPMVGQTITLTEGKTVLPLSGTFDVLTSASLKLTYVYPYVVTFTETGLTSGSWSVTIQGTTISEPYGTAIVFHLGNGTYSYHFGESELGYKGTGSPKKVIVDGAATGVVVTFTAKK